MDEITIGDKVYVSSKRAAQITGYAKDYVGQLCREGRVEARLVGRNWYVLDSAIREHRFGKSEEKTTSNEPEQRIEDPVSTWKRPEYVAETPAFVPTLAPKTDEQQLGTPAIADMQSAWREWFQEKQPVQAPSDEVSDSKVAFEAMVDEVAAIDEVSEEDSSTEGESEVILKRIDEDSATEEPEEAVEIRRSYVSHVAPQVAQDYAGAPSVMSSESQRPPAKPVQKGGSLLLQATLVLLALASALVALIGTGHAEKLFSGTSLDFGIQKQVVEFLGGKSEYKSSL